MTSGSGQSLPRRILEHLKWSPQNYGTFKVRPAEFWSNATCAPLFHGDIVMRAKISIKKSSKTEIVLFFQGYFCKPLLFQRSIHSLRIVFKEKNILCHSTFNVNAIIWVEQNCRVVGPVQQPSVLASSSSCLQSLPLLLLAVVTTIRNIWTEVRGQHIHYRAVRAKKIWLPELESDIWMDLNIRPQQFSWILRWLEMCNSFFLFKLLWLHIYQLYQISHYKLILLNWYLGI